MSLQGDNRITKSKRAIGNQIKTRNNLTANLKNHYLKFNQSDLLFVRKKCKECKDQQNSHYRISQRNIV